MKIPMSAIPRNGLIGIIYPSSRPPEERVQRGLSIIEDWGYRTREFKPGSAAEDYLAAPDEERTLAVMKAMADDEVDALWAVRGGYGAIRVLPGLTVPPRKDPVPLIGFSDVSLLLTHMAQRANWPAIHGPNVTTLSRLDIASEQAMQRVLAKGTFPDMTGMRTLVAGRAEGRLLVMNLTVLASVLGTPYEPDLGGVVLALEDTGEPAYRIDRLLQQLNWTKGTARLAGLVVGDLSSHEERPLIRELLVRFAASRRIPCCSGAPISHGAHNWPLPMNARVRLDSVLGHLEVLSR